MIKEACTSSTRVQVLEVVLGTPPVVADYRISAANTLQDGPVAASANDLLPGPPPVAAGPNQWAGHMYPVSYTYSVRDAARVLYRALTQVLLLLQSSRRFFAQPPDGSLFNFLDGMGGGDMP